MANQRPTLVIFQGGVSHPASRLERLVDEAQAAATLDLLGCAASSGAFERAILVTESQSLTSGAAITAGLPVQVESGRVATGGFHFGERLREICRAHGLERVVYAGGGAMPLATPDVLADIALAVSGPNPAVVSNNLYSADIVAFSPAAALDKIAPPSTDNDLAWLLHYRAGLPFGPLPRTLATGFDIDTPTDLAVLSCASSSGPLGGVVTGHLRAALAKTATDLPRLAAKVEQAYAVMAKRRAEVLVAGRVSSWVWRRLEVNLPCQTRIVSEERGMRAGGREERGEVRSMLGLYADLAGVAGLVGLFEEVADAAFLDTRVLFAHRRATLSRADRFAADALEATSVAEPWARELTEALAGARIPIVPGGHSLVSGGVWALSERVRGSAAARGGSG